MSSIADKATNPHIPLTVREITGSLTVTPTQVIAWFRLGVQPWTWRDDRAQNGAILNAERIYAAMTGIEGLPAEPLHMRVLPRPYPAHEWAKTIIETHVDPAVPAAFKKHIVVTQRRIQHSKLSENRVYVGVVVLDGRKAVDRLRAGVNGGRASTREKARVDGIVREVAQVIGMPGFAGKLARQADVEWLVRRSVGLHLPEPLELVAPIDKPLTETDMGRMTERFDVDPCVGRKYVRVSTVPDEDNQKPITRYVAVLCVGRMEELEVPEVNDPWIAESEKLPFPVEWSLRTTIRPGEDAARDMEKAVQKVDDQVGQYAKHHTETPEVLREVAKRARTLRHRMKTGKRSDAAAYEGWWRLAVAGRTPEELDERIRAVKNLYGSVIELERDKGQHALYRSFIPGEPLGPRTHTRRGELKYLAAGVPNMASRIGDKRGEYLGYTASISRRAVVWDPFYGIETKERSGLTPIIGGLGAGKSVLLGKLARWAAIAGIQTTILDPAGPLARLCYMPDLQAIAKHVDLMNSPAGTLSPYTVIPVPRRDDVLDDERLIPYWATIETAKAAHARAVEHADALAGGEPATPAEHDAAADVAADTTRSLTEAQTAYNAKVTELHDDAKFRAEKSRINLAIDVLRLLLPVEFRNRTARVVIAAACRSYGGSYHGSLDDVLTAIKADKRDKDHEIYDELKAISEYPSARLFFGSGVAAERAGEDIAEPVLLVFTMAGLQLPDEDRSEKDWSEEERIAVPLMTLAAHYTSKRIYLKKQTDPALVGLDEAHFLRRIPVGRALIVELARNSRKRTTRVLLPTQKCSDLNDLAAKGLIREVFGGRMDDDDEARAFLKLVGAPVTSKHVTTMVTMSGGAAAAQQQHDDDEAVDVQPREFVMRDAAGNIEIVRIDMVHQGELFDVLKTRRRTRRRRIEKSTAPLAGFDAAELLDDELVAA